jgi:alpha-D-ribose 1-methylphosphonate 5-triphosphate synthase subunit PhnI
MYVAVKGGERAIDNAHRLLAATRRGDRHQAAVTVGQIEQQLGLAVDRVMMEGSLYDRELAALAVKQAQGDLVEAVFLLRAFRTTLPRFGYSRPVRTDAMTVQRRVSATYKDLPGGQVLGPTYDYTHRLLDFALLADDAVPAPANETGVGDRGSEAMPRIADLLARDGMVETESPADEETAAGDLTREPLQVPTGRDVRLQNLARGDEGFLLAMAYSLQRGFGAAHHPFLGEIRMGRVAVVMAPPELDFEIEIGALTVTECVMLNRFNGSPERSPRFVQGYGLTFGHCERKAMAMALVDRALRWREMGEAPAHPAQNEEFVLFHSDNVEASGFVQHLKLPHYVDFQSELVLLRGLQADYANKLADEALRSNKEEDPS